MNNYDPTSPRETASARPFSARRRTEEVDGSWSLA
jgi:hypothetical protein